MTEPTSHCPYLGLKQNRAIRFASPTPEHRCFVSGEPLEIPVDQASYCLSQGHVHCPLYMGLTLPTTSDAPTLIGGLPPSGGALVAPSGGVRGWLGTLSPRDRAIYAIMISMLAIIVAIYLFVGLQTLFRRGEEPLVGTQPTLAPAADTAQATQPAALAPTAITSSTASSVVTNPTASSGAGQAATSEPPTPTDLPTEVPSPTPTVEPTREPVVLPPTSQLPTAPPTTAVAAATAVPPTAAPAATAVPPTAKPAAPSAPKPTAASKPPTAIPVPTAPPATSVMPLILYFGDTTGSVLVPVRRNASVQDNRVAEAAIRELIAGPRNGLRRLVAADAVLLGIRIDNGLATVNFDRDPSDGDDRGYDSIVLTLTDFGTVGRVQIQINSANLGGTRGRPVVNPTNPLNLAVDYSATEFLPLYFPSVDGAHDVRIISMVPKTKQVGEATVRALLDGPPPEYAGALRRVIPANTELRGIKLSDGVLLVDFTQPFADAPDLNAAMRTVVESLTTIKTVRGVQFLVEGQAFADGKVFGKPAINQE
ncbi:MAG TPA: GerMN domain-containing protein [Roseiflexaceae bacterium]|nr:GerMN domain-containing protein [Roseiflexaceae bacterium]